MERSWSNRCMASTVNRNWTAVSRTACLLLLDALFPDLVLDLEVLDHELDVHQASFFDLEVVAS